MEREVFLGKKNKLGILGYTDEELLKILSSEMFYVDDCPICKNKRLGRSSICSICGFEEEYETVKGFSKIYEEKLKKNPNYIFAVDEV